MHLRWAVAHPLGCHDLGLSR
nr:hypothetical protein [uncultured Pantoea sp.]